MTDKQFSTLFGGALADQDRDMYVSDWALTSGGIRKALTSRMIGSSPWERCGMWLILRSARSEQPLACLRLLLPSAFVSRAGR